MAKALIGCCGWSYGDLAEKGGWTGAFYPGTSTKKLPYYSKFFDTAEMDSSFYEKFYKYMTPATFRGMASATPDDFEFSVKVPETEKNWMFRKAPLIYLKNSWIKYPP